MGVGTRAVPGQERLSTPALALDGHGVSLDEGGADNVDLGGGGTGRGRLVGGGDLAGALGRIRCASHGRRRRGKLERPGFSAPSGGGRRQTPTSRHRL